MIEGFIENSVGYFELLDVTWISFFFYQYKRHGQLLCIGKKEREREKYISFYLKLILFIKEGLVGRWWLDKASLTRKLHKSMVSSSCYSWKQPLKIVPMKCWIITNMKPSERFIVVIVNTNNKCQNESLDICIYMLRENILVFISKLKVVIIIHE